MSNVTRIKICGITNREDALAAIDYGANALGFIFVPNTPRYIQNFPDAAAIPASLPPFISPVAVCLDASEAASFRGIAFQTIQFYQNKNSVEASRLENATAAGGRRMVQAFRIKDADSLEEIANALQNFRPDALLLDTYHKDKLGGSGETFNWDLAIEAKARFGLPVILAGGLTPDNVAEAVAKVQPYAVDVASGVEAEPGRKDHARLKAFIRAVQKANASLF